MAPSDRLGRTVLPDDAAWVARTVGRWQPSYRWQFRSAPPSRDRVRALLDDPDVVLQAIATGGPGRAVAVFQVSALSVENQVAELSLLVDGAEAEVVRDQLGRFVRRAFEHLGLRKLSLRALDGELDVEGCLPSVRLAGRLVEHDRRREGTYDDLVVHELWREDVDGPAA